MRIRQNFASRERSEAASNFLEAEVKAKYGNGKRPRGYKSGIKDRAEWTRQEKRGQESLRARDDKKDGGASTSPYQIVNFIPTPCCKLILAWCYVHVSGFLFFLFRALIRSSVLA